MAYTAPDARTFAKERKSLAEKITAELALIDSELDTLVVEAGMISNRILTGDKIANTASDNAIGGIPMIYEIAIEHASADNDIIITHKSKVLDFWFIPSGVPSVNDKVQLFNGVHAITDNIACVATESAVVRATTIDDTYSTINASGTMRVTAVADTAVAGKAYVMAIRVA